MKRKVLNGGLGRRLSAVRLVLCAILVVAAILGLPTPAGACGTGTHHEVVDLALEKLRAENTYPELVRLLDNNPGAVYAGSVFPDWPYGLAKLEEVLEVSGVYGSVAEDTHTDRFMQGYLQYLLANGICPLSDDGTRLDCETPDDEWTLAFLFGLISHHEADSAWHPDDPTKHTHPLPADSGRRFEAEAAAQEVIGTTHAEAKAEQWVNVDYGQIAKTTLIPRAWGYPHREALQEAYAYTGWGWGGLAELGLWEGMARLEFSHTALEVEAAAVQLIEDTCMEPFRRAAVLTPSSVAIGKSICRERSWIRQNLMSYELGGLNDCADKTVATWEQYWDRLTGRQEAASVTISGPTKVGPGQHIFTAVLKREYASPMAKWQWNNGNTVITTTLNTIKVGTYPVEAVTTMLNPIEVGTDPVEAMTTTLNFAEDGTYSVEVTAMDMWGHPLATGSHTVKVRSWEGSILDNKSGSTPTLRVESAIAVSVTGRPGLVVDIQSGGWAATCTTGNKPEYGPNACEFGGLRASTYTITPRGLGASVQVTVDGVGWALVQFDPVLAGPLHE